MDSSRSPKQELLDKNEIMKFFRRELIILIIFCAIIALVTIALNIYQPVMSRDNFYVVSTLFGILYFLFLLWRLLRGAITWAIKALKKKY